jgi:hypothetical protein
MKRILRKLTFVFLLLFSIISLFNCENCQFRKESKKEHVIKKIDTTKLLPTEEDGEIVEIVVCLRYYKCNFIVIDTMEGFFVHQANNYLPISWNYSENPEFGYFVPENFVWIKTKKCLLSYFQYDRKINEGIYIYNNRDTVRDNRVFEIQNFFLRNSIRNSIRRVSEEQEHIIHSIITKTDYRLDTIQWQRTAFVPSKDVLEKMAKEIQCVHNDY